MTAFTVVYDACVLYPAPLRDLLVEIAVKDLVRARWTERIHDEWIRSVLKSRPELKDQLERTRRLMDSHVRDCLVDGYEEIAQGLALPDPDDRHVLAAAIRCGAGAIITFNLTDFPEERLDPYHVEALHPDEFIADLFDIDEAAVCTVAKTVRARLKKPPVSADDYLAKLESQRLTETASRLHKFVDLI